MSTPADQMQLPQQGSPLDQYMSSYGARLQSMLASDPYGGTADPGIASAGSVSNLGPDLYTPNVPPIPQQSALAGPDRGGGDAGSAQQQGQATRPSVNSAPQSPAAAHQSPKEGGGAQGDGVSFRDMWKAQPKDARDQYLDKLQAHLKASQETIDSAYTTMMKQLGGRPDTSLSRSDKGMLLMEFGLRMMEHSRPQYGQSNTLGGSIGQAGAETMQSARGLINQKLGTQQRYDQMQQQLTIAHGKEQAQLASRSALEEGRDLRAFGQQDSMLERVREQQQGANQRNTDRISGAADRTNTTEAGKDRRQAASAGQVKRTVTGDDGSIYGVTGSGSLVQLEKDGKSIKANPGGGPGGGKLTAAQANYSLYMSTYGKDKDGKPLQGEDLQSAQTEALKYAANPRTYQLSEAQMRQMAEKSADSYIRANPTSWLGMDPKEIQDKRAQYAEDEFNRLKRGGPGSPAAPYVGRRSALDGASPGTAPRGTTAARGGAIPISPPPGSRGPNGRQLELLNKDPKANAQFFLQKFGYLPREYQQFVGQQSALAR